MTTARLAYAIDAWQNVSEEYREGVLHDLKASGRMSRDAAYNLLYAASVEPAAPRVTKKKKRKK